MKRSRSSRRLGHNGTHLASRRFAHADATRTRLRRLMIESLEQRVVLATVTWTGGAGNLVWTTSGNWDSGALPGAGDDVVIPDLGQASVTYNNIFGATTFNSLVSDVPFVIAAFVNPLNVTTSATFNADLTHGGGVTMGGDGDVTINGLYTWSGGSLSGAGTTVANGGVQIMGPGGHTLSRTLEVANGSATWSEGSISVSSSGVLRTTESGGFTIAGAFTMTGSGSVENQGFFRAAAGTGTAQVNPGFSNDGRIIVNDGRLLLNGGLTNFDSGSKTLTSGKYQVTGELAFSDADIATNSAAIVLDGPDGRISDPGGGNALAGLASNTGELTVQNGASLNTAAFSNTGAVTLSGASSLDVSDAYTQTGGTTFFQEDSFLARPTLTTGLVDIQGGVLMGSGTIVGNLTNGSQVSPGASGGVITVDGDYVQTDSASLDIELGGVITIDDATVLEGAGGSTDAIFDVNLSLPSSNEIVANYVTLDGSATVVGRDYTFSSGAVTFAPGETSQTIAVGVSGDGTDEEDESFTVQLFSGGRIVVEAENYTNRQTHTQGFEYTEIPAEAAGSPEIANFRGEGYLQSLPDDSTNFLDEDARGEIGGGYVEYTLQIETAGEYRLYPRWDAPNDGNSLHGSIVELSDGRGGVIADWYMWGESEDQNFATRPWDTNSGFEEGVLGNVVQPVPAVWEIDTPGEYTVRFAIRETGAAIDTFIFQLSSLPVPTGDGPAETSKVETTAAAFILDAQGIGAIQDDDAAPAAAAAAAQADLPGFDQLNVSGTATFDGSLNVSVVEGFSPSGSSFQFASFESATGNFATVNSSGVEVELNIEASGIAVQAGEATGSDTTVEARNIFYNNSFFDGDDASANADDDTAIATDKVALLPGETATFGNYTSYSRGMNGLLVDISALASTPNLATVSNYFEFRVGNDDMPDDWAAAPAPSDLVVRSGEGASGSDRVTLIWEDNAIANQWLQVTVLANASTGLADANVFYFGNAIGESGNSAADASVNAQDIGGPRDNPHNFLDRALVDDAFDYNRDSLVNAQDIGIARDNPTNFLNDVNLITVPAAAPLVAPASAIAPVSSSISEEVLLVPLENLAIIGEVSTASSQHVVNQAPLLAQPRLDDAYWRLDESGHTNPGSEQSDPLDWGDLLLESDLIELLAENSQSVQE